MLLVKLVWTTLETGIDRSRTHVRSYLLRFHVHAIKVMFNTVTRQPTKLFYNTIQSLFLVQFASHPLTDKDNESKSQCILDSSEVYVFACEVKARAFGNNFPQPCQIQIRQTISQITVAEFRALLSTSFLSPS